MIRLVVAASMLVLVGSAQAQLYWRADLGFSFSNRAGLRDRNFAADGVICADPTCTSPGKINDAGASPVLSAGLGWRFNRNFRADATLAYRGGYREQRTMPDGTEVKAHIKSWNLMANAYYDVPFTWGSPYVGAGLGFASNRIDKIAGTLQAPGGTQSGAAWALMAGASVPISSTYLEALEFGYRYIDLGKLQTDPGRLSGGLTPTYSGAAGRLKAHELTMGWRLRF